MPNCKIDLIEKEKDLSLHATGRNSGVLHAGFYYSTDSLRATYCRKGNESWHSYIEQHNLPIRKCGKLVVPRVIL
jgi:L-2-hydroxyglutarate oxidase LhgO